MLPEGAQHPAFQVLGPVCANKDKAACVGGSWACGRRKSYLIILPCCSCDVCAGKNPDAKCFWKNISMDAFTAGVTTSRWYNILILFMKARINS